MNDALKGHGKSPLETKQLFEVMKANIQLQQQQQQQQQQQEQERQVAEAEAEVRAVAAGEAAAAAEERRKAEEGDEDAHQDGHEAEGVGHEDPIGLGGGYHGGYHDNDTFDDEGYY